MSHRRRRGGTKSYFGEEAASQGGAEGEKNATCIYSSIGAGHYREATEEGGRDAQKSRWPECIGLSPPRRRLVVGMTMGGRPARTRFEGGRRKRNFARLAKSWGAKRGGNARRLIEHSLPFAKRREEEEDGCARGAFFARARVFARAPLF